MNGKTIALLIFFSGFAYILGIYSHIGYLQVKKLFKKTTKTSKEFKKQKLEVVSQFPINDHLFDVIVKSDMSNYDRDSFGPGITTRTNGNTESPREYVLKRDCQKKEDGSSFIVVDPITHKPTNGRWLCPYTGSIITDPKYIEIDHVVAVGEAWISGAQDWNARQKSQFARDTDNLIAVSAIANREKGPRGIDNWVPTRKPGAYVFKYITVKAKYNLGMSVEEIDTVRKFAKGA
jgi:hypothetical protein